VTSSESTVWECGDCSQPEDRQSPISAVCHHCGTLLCREHRYLIWDSAFRSIVPFRDQMAVHCRDCRDAYHHMPMWGGRAGSG
jgi:hypothetical protein